MVKRNRTETLSALYATPVFLQEEKTVKLMQEVHMAVKNTIFSFQEYLVGDKSAIKCLLTTAEMMFVNLM